MAWGADEQHSRAFKARVKWNIQALAIGTITNCTRTFGTTAEYQIAAVATHEAVLE
jgi:hypothetical protein